jgi:hypothetical protein
LLKPVVVFVLVIINYRCGLSKEEMGLSFKKMFDGKTSIVFENVA